MIALSQLRRHAIGAIAGVVVGAVPLFWWQASASLTARDDFLLAATDCHDGRSAMLSASHLELSFELQQAVTKAALVPTLGCLNKQRIEDWLVLSGVSAAELRRLENEALIRSSAPLEYVAADFLP